MPTKMTPLMRMGTFIGNDTWLPVAGWAGHATRELARRKRHRQMSHQSRKTNQRIARGRK